MEAIEKYFPNLSAPQLEKLARYAHWLEEKNKHINLISRKDTSQIGLHHICHSLVLTHSLELKSGMKVLDIGTGGGLPGIPLAICYPEVEFHLIDSIMKKVKAVEEAASHLELSNVGCSQLRAEAVTDKYDIIVSRAVARLKKLWNWSRPLLNGKKHNALLCLKGGDLKEELEEVGKKKIVSIPVNDYLEESHFNQKYIIIVSA